MAGQKDKTVSKFGKTSFSFLKNAEQKTKVFFWHWTKHENERKQENSLEALLFWEMGKESFHVRNEK